MRFFNRRSILLVMSVSAAVLVSGACSSSGEEEATQVANSLLEATPGVGSVRLVSAEPDVPAATNVTKGQLDQAVLSWATCLVERGLKVEFRFRPDRFNGVGNSISGTATQSDALEPSDRACREQAHFDSVVDGYMAENPVSDQQFKDIVLEYTRCVSALSPVAATQVQGQEDLSAGEVSAKLPETMMAVPRDQRDDVQACFDTAMGGPLRTMG